MLFVVTSLSLVGLYWMGCGVALLIPAGCDIVWMHPYAASLTIYILKKKVLLGTRISLSHVLSFLDLSLNSAL